jgi:hypothetical protein
LLPASAGKIVVTVKKLHATSAPTMSKMTAMIGSRSINAVCPLPA